MDVHGVVNVNTYDANDKKSRCLTGIFLECAMMVHVMHMPETMTVTVMTGLRLRGEGQYR